MISQGVWPNGFFGQRWRISCVIGLLDGFFYNAVRVGAVDFGLNPLIRTGGSAHNTRGSRDRYCCIIPLGIILARASAEMPAELICTVFIEFWRGVPLITVLFMASVMLPLFLPEGVNFDNLLRALIGVMLFSAAYMAEVIRGGLRN